MKGSDPHALVRAAIATGEDAELLVYADWLEEQGQTARAQLSTCRASGRGCRRGSGGREELAAEIEAVVAAHGEALRGELPALPGVTWGDFERGFVATAGVTDVTALNAVAARLGKDTPVTRLDLASADGGLEHELPWLRVLRVHVSPRVEDARLYAVPEVESTTTSAATSPGSRRRRACGD